MVIPLLLAFLVFNMFDAMLNTIIIIIISSSSSSNISINIILSSLSPYISRALNNNSNNCYY